MTATKYIRVNYTPSIQTVKLWYFKADRPGIFGIAEWQRTRMTKCNICGEWYKSSSIRGCCDESDIQRDLMLA